MDALAETPKLILVAALVNVDPYQRHYIQIFVPTYLHAATSTRESH